ncbi:MAG: hypothetical protein OK454_00170 [Thaumarchaeota archaeon]|nr:hypothetical protein [Nitrososphaerota archaeon]
MIAERTPGEKLAYADGFKQCIDWFEQRLQPGVERFGRINEARALHATMLGTLDPPRPTDGP